MQGRIKQSISEAVSQHATVCNSSVFEYVVRLATVTNAQLKCLVEINISFRDIVKKS